MEGKKRSKKQYEDFPNGRAPVSRLKRSLPTWPGIEKPRVLQKLGTQMAAEGKEFPTNGQGLERHGGSAVSLVLEASSWENDTPTRITHLVRHPSG